MTYFSGEKMTGGYGGPDIINSCTISVDKGEIVTILGPNGAGKSTAMRAMLGMLNLREGKITINEKDISSLSPQDRVKEGMVHVVGRRSTSGFHRGVASHPAQLLMVLGAGAVGVQGWAAVGF